MYISMGWSLGNFDNLHPRSHADVPEIYWRSYANTQQTTLLFTTELTSTKLKRQGRRNIDEQEIHCSDTNLNGLFERKAV